MDTYSPAVSSLWRLHSAGMVHRKFRFSLKLSFCASLPWWGGSTFHIIRSSHTRVDLKGIDPIPLACRHPQVTVHRNSKRIVPSRQGCMVFDLVTLIRCYLYHAQTLVVIISPANVQYFGLARRKEKHEINLSESQRTSHRMNTNDNDQES